MEEEINKCLIIFEVLGLQYFSLKSMTLKNLKDHPLWYRKLQLILVLAAAFLVVCYFFLQNDDLSVDPEKLTAKNVMTFAIQNTMNFGLIIVLCANVIQGYTSTLKTKRFYVNFKESARLSQEEFGTRFDFKKLKFQMFKRLLILILILLAVHGVTAAFSEKAFDGEFIDLFIGGALMFFLTTAAFKYVFYVIMINDQLEALEKIVESFVKTRPISTIDSLQFQIVNPKPYKSFDNSLLKLIAARKIYNKIYASGNLVNECHGFTILCSIVNLVITLTAVGYRTFVIAVSGMDKTKIMGKDYILTLAS